MNAHTMEDDFEHFLHYSSLANEPDGVKAKLKLAYEANWVPAQPAAEAVPAVDAQTVRDAALEEAAKRCKDIYSWRGTYSAGSMHTKTLSTAASAIRALKGTPAAAVADALSATKSALKLAYVNAVGNDTGWKGERGTWFIEGYLAAQSSGNSDDTRAFQNFHRALCERFGYTHDAVDWRRDQVSLIEHIARKLSGNSGELDAIAAYKYLQGNDYRLLHRFIETTEDDEGYDIGKDAVKRLAELGVLQNNGFGRYSVTAFGYHAHETYWHQESALPLMTNTDRDERQRAAIAAMGKESAS